MTDAFENDMPVADSLPLSLNIFSSERRIGVEMKVELECWYLKNIATE